jgi:hypothetical protein
VTKAALGLAQTGLVEHRLESVDHPGMGDEHLLQEEHVVAGDPHRGVRGAMGGGCCERLDGEGRSFEDESVQWSLPGGSLQPDP